jgi:hypothetical protein
VLAGDAQTFAQQRDELQRHVRLAVHECQEIPSARSRSSHRIGGARPAVEQRDLSALSIHFEPSGSFLLTRSITALALLSIPKQRALRRKRMAGFR